jgi:hypothetical protein
MLLILLSKALSTAASPNNPLSSFAYLFRSITRVKHHDAGTEKTACRLKQRAMTNDCFSRRDLQASGLLAASKTRIYDARRMHLRMAPALG